MEPTRIYVYRDSKEGGYMAHVPSLPGVCAMHPDRATAVGRALRVLQEEILFRKTNLLPQPSLDLNLPIELDPIADNVFPEDLVPLTRDELQHLLERMALARERFARLVRGLGPRELQRGPPGGWNVAQILEHVAMAECWYLDRMVPLPEDAAGAASGARLLLIDRLRALTEDELSATSSFLGEDWTVRKVLRRSLELETTWAEFIQSLPVGDSGVPRPGLYWRGNATVESDLFPCRRQDVSDGIDQLLDRGLQLSGWLRGSGQEPWRGAPSAEREQRDEALRQLATAHMYFRLRLGRWLADPLARLAQVRILAVQKLESLEERDL
jgi:predicted RNase H-like HicB family nuclease/uncharacterized damage-inducible protein DinB